MKRQFAKAGCLLLLAVGLVDAAERYEQPVIVNCASQVQTIVVPAEAGVAIQSNASEPLFLEVRETGQLLTATEEAGAIVSTIPVPYRYGTHRVELAPEKILHVQRAFSSLSRPTSAMPATARGTNAEISISCGTEPPDRRRREWLSQVARISEPLTTFAAAGHPRELLRDIDRLAASAEGASDAALATHVRAQILLLSNRSADSVGAFADAAKRWQAVGDEARARVALVGEVEDLQRLARHGEALALVDAAAAKLPRDDYFAARLRLSRCLTLRYLARMNEALACFREGSAAMEKLGEIPDLVSALQDMSDVSRFLGDSAGARRVGEHALKQAVMPQMEIQRGRIHRLLGEIALDRGDVETAITEQDLALTEFVASKSPRWEANALLRSAELYVALGTLEEASDLVSAAMANFSKRDAPARVAAAQVVRADIDMRLNRIDAARAGLEDAVATYKKLGMPADLDSAQLAQSRLGLRSGAIPAVAALLAERDLKQQLNVVDWRLIEAQVFAARGNCAKAEQGLRRLDGQQLSIQNELDRVQVRAGCLATTGDTGGAQARLLAMAKRIAALAQAVDSPLLRQMLTGYIAPLRKRAFSITFSDAVATMEPTAIWQWLRLDDVSSSAPGLERSSLDASKFDAEVAAELLAKAPISATSQSTTTTTTGQASAAAPRRLLALLAADSNITTTPKKVPVSTKPQLTLASFQQRLGDAMYVSYIDAGEHSQLLWISRDSVRLQPTVDPVRLRADTERLLGDIADVRTPLPTIAIAAQSLSQRLLSNDQADNVPSRLLIDAESPLASLPWSVLSGRDANPLLETTQVSIVRIAAEPDPVPALAGTTPPDVSIFVAGQSSASGLGKLLNASAEPALIANAIAVNGGTTQRLVANDRAALLDAFARPNPWLHVAAHGDARASRIGYAGIWLEPVSNQSPQFVSWLEILARGSRKQLVVLNACDLAASQGGSSAGLSFADAVSRAGARDVVAARWQVSDAATALWVPTFYQNVSVDLDPASALLAAQRRLRDSRMFRHPFYWAGYVHYGRL